MITILRKQHRHIDDRHRSSAFLSSFISAKMDFRAKPDRWTNLRSQHYAWRSSGTSSELAQRLGMVRCFRSSWKCDQSGRLTSIHGQPPGGGAEAERLGFNDHERDFDVRKASALSRGNADVNKARELSRPRFLDGIQRAQIEELAGDQLRPDRIKALRDRVNSGIEQIELEQA